MWRAGVFSTLMLCGAVCSPAFADPVPVPPPDPTPAPHSLAETSLAIDKQTKYSASPADWRDEVIYFAMIDRFAKGPGSKPQGDPTSGLSWHGGNLTGLTSKLDYIKGLGATTLWLNPVVANDDLGYHGYAATNFLAVDPRFGTMGDLKTLVKEAHARGMKVVLDVVVNHAGHVFEYKEGDKWVGESSPPKTISKWDHALSPTELQNPESFHRRGVVDVQNHGWDDPNQSHNGDFPGQTPLNALRDFKTEDRSVQNKLIRTYLWWMKETDCDGFRLDTVKHTDPSMWPRFDRAVRTYANKLGKQNFLLLGEVFDGDDHKVSSFIGKNMGIDPRTGKALGLDSAFNFPALFHDHAALHGKAPTSQLAQSLQTTGKVFGTPDASRMVRLLDNHDVPRFLGTQDAKSQLKVALAHTMLASGIPSIYYGTEQAFRQPEGKPTDPGNREDMFAGGYESPSSAGDNFKTNAPLYRYLRKLSDLRETYPALRRGEEWVRKSDASGPGVYAFSRILGKQEVLVVINTSDQRRRADDVWVDGNLSPVGTKLVDAIHPGHRDSRPTVRAAKGGGSQVDVVVPPRGVRVFVHDSDYQPAPSLRRFDGNGKDITRAVVRTPAPSTRSATRLPRAAFRSGR